MGLLKKEIQKLKRLKENRIDRIGRDSVVKNQETIIYTLQSQLHEGRVTERNLAAPSYSETTLEYAEDPQKAPRAGIIGDNQYKSGKYNFEWTGDFFDSMRIGLSKEDFYIQADPSKTAGLLALRKMRNRGWSHNQLLELSEENEKDLVKKLIEPEIYYQILDELGKIII